jgi:hypothetical protein
LLQSSLLHWSSDRLLLHRSLRLHWLRLHRLWLCWLLLSWLLLSWLLLLHRLLWLLCRRSREWSINDVHDGVLGEDVCREYSGSTDGPLCTELVDGRGGRGGSAGSWSRRLSTVERKRLTAEGSQLRARLEGQRRNSAAEDVGLQQQGWNKEHRGKEKEARTGKANESAAARQRRIPLAQRGELCSCASA